MKTEIKPINLKNLYSNKKNCGYRDSSINAKRCSKMIKTKNGWLNLK